VKIDKRVDKLLVLGSGGRLGLAIAHHAPELFKDLDIVFHYGRKPIAGLGESCDLTDINAVLSLFKKVNPAFILNLAAITDVDFCESNSQVAINSNVTAVKNIAFASQVCGARLVHISTDHVYASSGLSAENDTDIKNVYALTKYAGESYVLNAGGVVLRTNFFGKTFSVSRKDFTGWIYDNLRSGKTIQAFHDVYFSPLSIKTLIRCIGIVLRSNVNGLFNLGSRDGCSKYDFIMEFARLIGYENGDIRSASIEDMRSLKAPRPKDMRMNSSNFEKTFGTMLPLIIDEIDNVSKEYE